MTHDQSAPAPVEVTQADRDRAEAFWQEYGPFRMGTVSALSAAFARHRITHSAPAGKVKLVEALKRLLEEYVSNVDSHRLGGFYLDPEKEECVVEARALLAKHTRAQGAG